MKAMWTQANAEYHGEFVNFTAMMARPKPVQKPHPPVIVGGAFPYSARRTIRYGEAWIPQATRYREIADMIPKLREMAVQAGRDPKSIEITLWFPRRDADLMKRYQHLGVSRVVLNLESEKADTVLPVIDAVGTLMHQVNG
jgi:alkanesulfonate monooxygenase SsuD/methylene tetrahydromethanopterin reductase-like flavin-dependent oxidoreductase (luciferase family)